MGKRIDIAGQRFGRLLVIDKGPSSTGKNPLTQWNCVCDCGEARLVGTMNLVRGRAKSCGCLHKEIVGKNSIRHGLHNSGAYKSWHAMLGRCQNKTNGAFPNYGGRGVVVCERWKSFENFYADMGERPEGKTLDRFPNSNGDYEPGNCRWATKEEQDNNKRTNVYVTWNGKTQTYAQWGKELKQDPSILRRRFLKFGTFDPIKRDRSSYLRKDRRDEMNDRVKPQLEIAMIEVSSSQIHSIGHDATSNTLAIRFKGKAGAGSLYHYANFTAAEFEAFKNAESIGAHFGKFIKPETIKYPFTKIESATGA